MSAASDRRPSGADVEEALEGRGVSPSVPPEGPRVLLLDDSAFVADITRDALCRRGMDVRVASSVSQLNALLAAWSPTVVLVDVNMPEIAGTDVCRWIKARVATQHLPVLLFSEASDETLAELAAQCGADGYVSKQRGVEGVADRVSSVCEEIVW